MGGVLHPSQLDYSRSLYVILRQDDQLNAIT